MSIQRHLFITDPLEKLNLNLDSSLRIAHQLCFRGHHCFLAHAEDFFWDSRESSASAFVKRIAFCEEKIEDLFLGDRQKALLGSFSGIHIRKEPPLDTSYITLTWMLDSAIECAKIFNLPSALRKYNEKLVIFQFPEFCKPAIVSNDPRKLLNFIKDRCGGDAVIKPLDGFGGRGIYRLNLRHSREADVESHLTTMTNGSRLHHLVQAFDSAIFDGEIRAFTVGGKAICWALKKPSKGNFLANTSEGATIHPFSPPNLLQTKIDSVAKSLYENGIAFAGFDIIGESISEINITSPRLLHPSKDGHNYYSEIAQWIEDESTCYC